MQLPCPIKALGGRLYDNALAESIIGLYKTELIARRGPWRHCEAVELATLQWVHWYNHRRLFGPLGHVPPAAFEAHYDHQLRESAMAARLKQFTLRDSRGGSLAELAQQYDMHPNQIQDWRGRLVGSAERLFERGAA